MSETSYSPSSQGEPAPGELELVRAFINTRELDPDVEEIASPESLATWLAGRGIEVPASLTAGDVERAREFREAVRALLLARETGEGHDDAVRRIRAAAEPARLRFEIGPGGEMRPAPACHGVDALMARVLAIASAAQETGEWERLKVCVSDECLLAFYDRSRNRSRHWCSMEVCGNRAKTRAYRAKRS